MRSQTKTLPIRLRKPVSALGKRLADARVARRISQSLMAERCGVARVTISKLENGDPTVGMETLFRYLGVLGLEGDIDLLAGNDKVGHELAMAQLSRKGRKPADRAVSR